MDFLHSHSILWRIVREIKIKFTIQSRLFGYRIFERISEVFYTVKSEIHSNEDVTNSYIWHFSESIISYFLSKYRFGTNSHCIAVWYRLQKYSFLSSKTRISLDFYTFIKKRKDLRNPSQKTSHKILWYFFIF